MPRRDISLQLATDRVDGTGRVRVRLVRAAWRTSTGADSPPRMAGASSLGVGLKRCSPTSGAVMALMAPRPRPPTATRTPAPNSRRVCFTPMPGPSSARPGVHANVSPALFEYGRRSCAAAQT